MIQSRLRCAALLLLTSLAACGTPQPRIEIEKVVPVSGTLTYRGQPAEQYEVTFYPTDARRAAVGLTDAKGQFKLGTNGIGDGAPPGMNRIGVSYLTVSADDVTGSSDGRTYLRQPKVKIPAKFGNPETSGLTQDVPSSGLPDLKLDLN